MIRMKLTEYVRRGYGLQRNRNDDIHASFTNNPTGINQHTTGRKTGEYRKDSPRLSRIAITPRAFNIIIGIQKSNPDHIMTKSEVIEMLYDTYCDAYGTPDNEVG